MNPDTPAFDGLLALAALMQGVAVGYGIVLLKRRRGAAGAWLFLLGAMLSMLVWRIVVLAGVQPPRFFNPLIAIWGSSCMVVAMFLFGREVARRERAEAERDELLARERDARRDAEQASHLKDQFLATLSHELRTPLAAILSWCAIVRLRPDSAADVHRAVDTIERSARAQARLVDDLLDVTRMQAGALSLERNRIALDAPVRAAIESIQPIADKKGVTIAFACDAGAWIDGDVGRMQQVATNLIGNAVKFSAKGGHVTVEVRLDRDEVELSVADDGEGIEPAFLPHVFDRFRQADSTVTRRHGGLGLGLAIVAHLVGLHGGVVRAESAGLGCGARFVVRLPRVAEATARDRVPATVPVSVPSGALDLRAVRILLVDDEEDVRVGLARLLEDAGAEVVALESGAEVVNALEAHRPHVLLLDIGMPGEDGYSVLRRIRSLPASGGGDAPAISLTAHARSEDRARAFASGFQRHLPKPIDFPLLVETIRALVMPEQSLVAVEADTEGNLRASPVVGGSGDIVGFVRADGLVRVAPELDGLSAGSRVLVDLL